MSYELEHLGVMTSDPAALAAWYCWVFGFEIVLRSDTSPPAFFLAGGGGSMLEICPWKEGVRALSTGTRWTRWATRF